MLPPLDPPFHGQYDLKIFEPVQLAAREISDIYLEEFKRDPRFLKAQPVLLGSWARSQISPKSDLDVGFWATDPRSLEFVAELQKMPLAFRGRILSSEDIQQWPVPEQMAFLEYRALTPEAEELSKLERSRLISAKVQQKRRWIRDLKSERDHRRSLGYQFENVLEPHLKTGRGGLRDIQQAMHLFHLCPELGFETHAFEVMQTYLWFFTHIRFVLQSVGGGDFLQAGLQPEVAERLGFENFKSFMREVQQGLSRVAFYSDWMFEWAIAKPEIREKYRNIKFESGEACLKALKRDSGLLMQHQVRRQMDQLLNKRWVQTHPEDIEGFRLFVFSKHSDAETLRAVFRSRILDHIDPRLRKLVGLNQHDQYHAFTADTHILNLLLGLKRVLEKPKFLGRFAQFVKDLTSREEQILALSCYYHDLAKGQGGDHEELGEKWVREDGKKFGRNEALTEEVAWIVRNHLEFSKAAFREDPRSEKTWQRLFALGLNEDRIRRLMIFTVLDIQATHPKAWTPWKEKLLAELAQNLLSPNRLKTIQASKKISKNFNVPEFDLSFLESVSPSRLTQDLRRMELIAQERGFRVEKVRGGFWVRYFDRQDRPGVLVQALKSLFAAGVSVQEAWVNSVPGIGVYDWFFVDSGMKQETFQKRLNLLDPNMVKIPKLQWSELQIEKDPQSENWILHLSGRDQRGLLMWTVEQLSDLGADIVSARIQTWGERAEDRLELRWPKSISVSPDLEGRLRQQLQA